MELLFGVIPIKGVTFLMFSIFAIIAVGFAFGRITVKGVSLGDAAVFIAALVFGALFYESLEAQLTVKTIAGNVSYVSNALKIVEALGLVLFVTSVGFIAGPKFFGNMKRNFKSYVLLGFVIILAGALSAAACIGMGEIVGYGSNITEQDGFVAMIVGLLSGSLTSTPAFSAAKATAAAEYEALVSVGHGIAYIFGVIGVVLFVQLIPKLTQANMEEERAKIVIAETGEKKTKGGK